MGAHVPPQAPWDDMTIQETLDTTLTDGGGTFDTATLQPVTDGAWAVGGSMPGTTLRLTDYRAYADLLRTFAEHYIDILASGARYVGTWIDDDLLYIDAIDIIDDTDTAIRLAAERGERAIYHLTDKITLEVSRDGNAD